MKILIISLAFLLTLIGNFLLASSHTNLEGENSKKFESAVKFVADQKYVEAVKEFKVLAEAGLPEAQFNLAILNLNGLGTPKNFKEALYWSWYAHLNAHESALNQVDEIYSQINEALRDNVANAIIEELLLLANAGDRIAALNLGRTYMQLLVVPDYQSSYVWLSIAQAYGLEGVGDLLQTATKQLSLEQVLEQQEKAAETFAQINP